MAVYAMTGGATGIGAAVKTRLREEGHEVIVVDIHDADVIADLSTPEGRALAVAGIRERAPGGLDGFVPCAGLGPYVEPLSRICQVNYFAAVATTEGVKDLLAQRRGCVVMISSNSASMPGYDPQFIELLLAGDEAAACALIDTLDGQTAYGGSKLGLTRWMRRNSTAWAQAGVRLNAVAPGITRTALTDGVYQDPRFGQIMKEFGDSVPTGSIARPEQIASAVCYLLRPEADFFCGAVLFVDGGHDAMLRPDQF
ncbi:MAG: SDR family oxidoreductase [Spongiibacteraceae bacterium]|jgi:NAD(P)-dependent dehydrogenase (short-subunit alcohol dehydrogenase family)|nr:SDR family oxidoreductase [Spongiibacteraceae bacterium]